MSELRAYRSEDIEKLCRTIDRVCADTPWMSSRSFMPTREWAHALENQDCQFHQIFIKESDDEVVGWCRIFPSDCEATSSQAELGMGLLAPYRNQGLGTEFITKSLEWAKTAGLRKVNLTVSPQNAIAIHVFEKCGFRSTKLSKDKVYMSISLRNGRIAS